MNRVALLISTGLALAVATPASAGALVPANDICGRAAPVAGADLASTQEVVQLATDWVHAINTANDAAYVKFIRDRGPLLLDGPERWLELRDNLRGVRLCGVKSADADKVELWAFDPNFDSYGIGQFAPAKGPADKIKFVFFAGTWESPSGAVPPVKLALPDLIAAVKERAATRAAEDRFSGAVLIAQQGKPLFEQAYGEADRTKHAPNTLDTQFRFGSMGKMFTAVAIMQLVQDGKVALDAPIGRYLTDYPNQDVATKVTVANLLTHTGGTGDIFGPDFDRMKGSLRTAQDYVNLYGTRALDFAPGSRQSYSNYGFMLLGRIVEAASGQDYDAYLKRAIFAPAGMASTGNEPESVVLPRRAISYMGAGARLKSAEATLPMNGTPAGGGYATVGDFQRFVAGLTGHRLLRAETLQKLIEGGVTMSDGKFVGFDFGGTTPGVGRFIGHGGGAPGMSGSLQHYLKSGVTIAVLANRDPGASESIAMFAGHRLKAD